MTDNKTKMIDKPLAPAQSWLAREKQKIDARGSYMNRVYTQPKPVYDGRPTPDELVAAMLRDHRFKRIMLANAEQIFLSIPPDVKLQLFREAAKEMFNKYKIKDVKQIYLLLGKEQRLDKQKQKEGEKHGK
jgi:hypothetical protein